MTFADLKNKYESKEKASIEELYKHYMSRKADTLVDSLAAAIALSSIITGKAIDTDALTPQMNEAFSLLFPDMSISDLESFNSEQIEGVINNWKGKLFEVEVRDRLNNGELVGDISLGDGQYAELAKNVNQPGWDLQILNSDGTVDEFLQLKATDSMSYINDALEKYPDIDILATSEVSELSDIVINSDISNEELTAPLTDLLDGGEDFLDMLVPGLPFLIIAASEGRKVFVKKTDWQTASNNLIERGAKTGLALGVGWLAFDFTGMGWLGVAASFGVRHLVDRMERGYKIEKFLPVLEEKTDDLLLLREYYS